MEPTHLAEMIERVMTGDPWHSSNVRQTLEGIGVRQAAERLPGASHGIWEIVLHMTGWAREVAARIGGRAAQEPDGGDWPPIEAATAEGWAAAQAALFEAHEALAAAVRGLDPRLLDRPVLDDRDRAAGTGLSHRLTLHGLVHHTVYHAGQIALLKRATGQAR